MLILDSAINAIILEQEKRADLKWENNTFK